MTDQLTIPRHIAIVMDGNGRWARAKHRPRFMGHKKGVEAVRDIVKACAELKVECLSLFAFSSENWKRPEEEISNLMSLFMLALEREAKALARNNVKLQIVGDLEQFSEKLQKKIKQVEQLTAESDGLKLIVAANYGGRWDVTQATKSIAQKVVDKDLKIDEITEDDVCENISTYGIPDPDLFIRTGGEKRISNFLIWQMAYTELYFTDVLWPDFDANELNLAIEDYSSRQRRFGKTSEQVIAEKNSADKSVSEKND
ncbi:isoprenyl transferase [Cocleimonas sp. KMM 6892]|uniref:isoprenyl transferase n=1 Tax=unclassified Cocleimonas TaxID=2639732 RepID=UPI002DBCC671|nr:MULTISPECIES: isoprenyl transferase [unclassified Cocleimonas]MEB8431022.1 isoprenyl transferase [Cocleimonas sp. KMM 6892]MEC4714206.1 isoprenyl transferase [Cocleimonas sp. KMM 6895]MEC4743537.1 isoprenyl transferase [Cocleimonas sp. KMM 6896]